LLRPNGIQSATMGQTGVWFAIASLKIARLAAN
jgi:hypothetical protein